MTDKSLPANIDAERATLGSILLNREAIVAIAPWLTPEHFYLETHAAIYRAMLACYRARTPPDVRLVAAELKKHDQLDTIGGIPYLGELVSDVPTSYHVEHYARIVERTAVLRRLIVAGGRIAALGYDEQEGLDQTIADAQAALNQATLRATDSGFVPYAEIAHQAFTTYDESDEVPGIPTGFVDLDDCLIGGFHRQDLIILAARPSVGKSALAGCIAAQTAEAGYPVLIISLEMDRESWFVRNAAALSGVNLAAIRARRVRDAELAPFLSAIGDAGHLPIAVNDAATHTVASLRSAVLKWIAAHGTPGLIVVDYLQLLSSPRRDGNRVQEVADISRSLKQLARETDAPVLALSQLSRAVEGRASHVPLLSDLRESGALEQDADVVMFIYREELHDKETDKRGIAEIHIAKHRQGPLGVVPLRFDASTTRFLTLTYRTPEGY